MVSSERLISYPEHRKLVLENGSLTEDDFLTDLNKRVFSFVMQNVRDNNSHSLDFNSEFSQDEVGRIMRMKISRMELSDNGDEILEQCIATLKKSVYKEKSKSTDTIASLDELLNSKRNN